MTNTQPEPIPIPFWVRGPLTLYRWRPACYEHRQKFKTEAEYEAHWRAEHGREGLTE